MNRSLILLVISALAIIATPSIMASPDDHYNELLSQTEVVQIVADDTGKLPIGSISGSSVRNLIEEVNQTTGRIFLNKPEKDARIYIYDKGDIPIILQSTVNMSGTVMPTVFASRGAFGSTPLRITMPNNSTVSASVQSGIVCNSDTLTIDFVNINAWLLGASQEIMASMLLPADWEAI